MNIRAITAAIVMLAASAAWADPVSLKVKGGLLIRPDDSMVEVDAGLYLNDEARQVVQNSLLKMEDQNKQLISALDSANKKIAACDATIPGFPTWAGVLLSAALTVASGVVAFFAVREATNAR